MHRNLLMKYNDLPIETQSPYSTLSSTNQKPKKLTNISISSGSSCSDTDSEFEYVLEKKTNKQHYTSNQRGGRIVTMKFYQTNQNQKVIQLKL